MVIPGIYVQGYCMYECTGIQVYSITSGAMALQCITLYRYTVIHQRSFCYLFCGCQLYNSILSIALQVIYNPLQRMASSCVLRMCQMRSKSCNGDGLAMHGRFSDGQPSKLHISLSLLSKIGDYRQSGMSSPWNRCDALSFKQRSHRSLRNAKIRGFAIPEV